MKLLATLASSLLLFQQLQAAESTAQTPQKAVLVTGASTGIGRKVTERLAAEGYFVYAGARKAQDLQALGAINNVQAIRLDVTSAQDISAAVDVITKAGRGLYGLVNNAGIATIGPIVSSSDDEFDLTMKVNVYGPFRMTKAFAPLVIAANGRIVNISSISGILNSTSTGVYEMSKHALEAFSDSLALQLAPQGVQVIAVEPGAYNSEIGFNAVKRLGLPKQVGDRSALKPPDEVAATVARALSDVPPKSHYMIVPDQAAAEKTIRSAIAAVTRLNEDQAYTYDRAALIRFLDEALAKTRPVSNVAAPASVTPAR